MYLRDVCASGGERRAAAARRSVSLVGQPGQVHLVHHLGHGDDEVLYLGALGVNLRLSVEENLRRVFHDDGLDLFQRVEPGLGGFGRPLSQDEFSISGLE